MKPPRNPAALAAYLRGDMANAAAASVPGGIEAQEAAGQLELVVSKLFPRDLHPSAESWASLGFAFGPSQDDVLVPAILPPGWTLRATEGSYLTDVLDGSGRKRAKVFYKAAFYDRRARAWLLPRYEVGSLYDGGALIGASVWDGDVTVASFIDKANPDHCPALAWAWLDERYPHWRDPLAYWDDAGTPASG